MSLSKIISCGVFFGVFFALFFSMHFATAVTLNSDNSITCSQFTEGYNILSNPTEAQVDVWFYNVTTNQKISYFFVKVISLSHSLDITASDNYGAIKVKPMGFQKLENALLDDYHVYTFQLEFDRPIDNGFGREFIHISYSTTVAYWKDNYNLVLYIPLYFQNVNVRDSGVVVVNGEGVDIKFERPYDLNQVDYSDYSQNPDNSHLIILYFDNKLQDLSRSSGHALTVTYAKLSLSPREILDQYNKIKNKFSDTQRALIIAIGGIFATLSIGIVGIVYSNRKTKKLIRELLRSGESQLPRETRPIISRERRRMMDKLDDLLLFLVPSSVIVINIAAAFGQRLLIPFLPILIPAFIMPIYFGYIRGAIFDSPKERARGWIYFSVGIVLYLGFFIYYLLGKTALTELVTGKTLAAIITIVYGAVFFLPILFFLIYKIGFYVGEKIFEISGQEVPPTFRKRVIYLETLAPSTVLTLACYYSAASLDLWYNENIAQYSYIVAAIGLFIFFLSWPWISSRIEKKIDMKQRGTSRR